MAVGGRGASVNDVGTYTLSLKDVSADDYTASTSTTGTVQVEGETAAVIEKPHDED